MECAVWFMRHGSPDYELCDNEHDAAGFVYYMAESGSGVLSGIQFADGRIIKADDWDGPERYAEELDRDKAARPPSPPPETRTVHDPFSRQDAEVFTKDPSWVGIAF